MCMVVFFSSFFLVGGTISANISTSCLVEIPEKSYRMQHMTSVPRGYCYIINNVYFRTFKKRDGSIKDAKALGDLFGDYLGFAVCRFNNQSSIGDRCVH